MIKILFVEDEPVLGKLVKEALEHKEYELNWCTNGADGLAHFKKEGADICILDVMLPGMDGFTLAKQLRSISKDVPILFLTARSQTADLIKGFEAGGNDYLKKPFSLDELYLRLQELLRRNTAGKNSEDDSVHCFQIGNYQFFPATQLLKCDKESFNLTYKESELLKELVKNKNNLMERKPVLIKLWGDDSFFNARNMDVYIAKLRKRLMHDQTLSIVNIRGYGYKLIEQVD